MENLTLSNLTEKQFVPYQMEELDGCFRSYCYAFKMLDTKYYVATHSFIEGNKEQIYVQYDHIDYDFETMEDAICFALGGSIVADIAEDYKHYHKQDDNVYTEEKFVELAHGIIERCANKMQANVDQIDKLKAGAKEYASVWI